VQQDVAFGAVGAATANEVEAIATSARINLDMGNSVLRYRI
jgi:hypothetical protein